MEAFRSSTQLQQGSSKQTKSVVVSHVLLKSVVVGVWAWKIDVEMPCAIDTKL